MEKKLEERICQNRSCGEKFFSNRKGQKFCCLKCNIEEQRRKKREITAEYYKTHKRGERYTRKPYFACSYCHKRFQLDFNPMKEPTKMFNIICPFCKNINNKPKYD